MKCDHIRRDCATSASSILSYLMPGGSQQALSGVQWCRHRHLAGQANFGWESVHPHTSKNSCLRFRAFCVYMNTVPSFDRLQFIKNIKVQLLLIATQALLAAQMATRSIHKGNTKVPSIFLFDHPVFSSKMNLFSPSPIGLLSQFLRL